MVPKDYYKILSVKKTATTGDIKKSYRKLAMKYHPDKNQGDELAESVFSDIAEAYNILSDPARRQEYNQKKFNVYGKWQDEEPEVSQASIMAILNKLQQILATLNLLRINRNALYFSIMQVLTDYNVAFLKKENDILYKQQVIEKLIECCKALSFIQMQKVSSVLFDIAGEDINMRTAVKNFVEHANRNNTWNKYKVLVAIAVAVILCLLIFLISR